MGWEAEISLGVAWLTGACGGTFTSDPEPREAAASDTGGTGSGTSTAGAPLASSGGAVDAGSAGTSPELAACPGLEDAEDYACGVTRLPWAPRIEDEPCFLYLPFELVTQNETHVNVLVDCEYKHAVNDDGGYCWSVVNPNLIHFMGPCCARIELEAPSRVDVIMGCDLIR